MIEEGCQLISLSKNILDSKIILILWGEIKRQRDLELLNIFFTKCLIQTFPLNHYIRFHFNLKA